MLAGRRRESTDWWASSWVPALECVACRWCACARACFCRAGGRSVAGLAFPRSGLAPISCARPAYHSRTNQRTGTGAIGTRQLRTLDAAPVCAMRDATQCRQIRHSQPHGAPRLGGGLGGRWAHSAGLAVLRTARACAGLGWLPAAYPAHHTSENSEAPRAEGTTPGSSCVNLRPSLCASAPGRSPAPLTPYPGIRACTETRPALTPV